MPRVRTVDERAPRFCPCHVVQFGGVPPNDVFIRLSSFDGIDTEVTVPYLSLTYTEKIFVRVWVLGGVSSGALPASEGSLKPCVAYLTKNDKSFNDKKYKDGWKIDMREEFWDAFNRTSINVKSEFVTDEDVENSLFVVPPTPVNQISTKIARIRESPTSGEVAKQAQLAYLLDKQAEAEQQRKVIYDILDKSKIQTGAGILKGVMRTLAKAEFPLDHMNVLAAVFHNIDPEFLHREFIEVRHLPLIPVEPKKKVRNDDEKKEAEKKKSNRKIDAVSLLFLYCFYCFFPMSLLFFSHIGPTLRKDRPRAVPPRVPEDD